MDTMHGRGSPKSQKTFRGFACGNHEIIDYTEFGLGQINPIRYRSYYYDVETGLYYLHSRYYDPVTGRFISMDDINYLDPETIGGTNLYAYCNNNPVMYVDPSGKFPWLALLIISGILIVGGTTLGGISAHQNGRDVSTGILEGAVAGLLIAGSIWLMVGSFYVPNGITSNLGLAMFTYGFSTFAGMFEAGVTQIRYSNSEGMHWSSNLTRSLAANALSVYLLKSITKSTPLFTQFAFHIGEKYIYTVPGEGGFFYDYRTTGEAFGIFTNYFKGLAKPFSYITAGLGIGLSLYNLYNAIWGEPNYNKWNVF